MTISSENEFFFVMYAFGRHENVFHKKWVATDCILLFLEYYSADVIRFCRTHFEFFRFIQLIVIGFDFSSACESILCCHVIVDWKWFYWKISFYEGGRRGGGGYWRVWMRGLSCIWALGIRLFFFGVPKLQRCLVTSHVQFSILSWGVWCWRSMGGGGSRAGSFHPCVLWIFGQKCNQRWCYAPPPSSITAHRVYQTVLK